MARGTDLPSIPLSPRGTKSRENFPSERFWESNSSALGKQASTSGASSLGSKVYSALQGRGRIFWKALQFRWGRSPTLGDGAGAFTKQCWSEQVSDLAWQAESFAGGAFSWVTGKDVRREQSLGKPWRRWIDTVDRGSREGGSVDRVGSLCSELWQLKREKPTSFYAVLA